MTLHVQTARISYRGPERLDVTRGSGKEGLPFAPSWALLAWAKERLRTAAEMGDTDLADLVWEHYRKRYVAEMRDSYRTHRGDWDALLARDRVVLCCYCPSRERCHRGLLAGLLVELGAVDEGELEPNPNQLELKL